MVARFHYNEQTLKHFLEDELKGEALGEVTAHVETCSDCQEKLETLSEKEISWYEVRTHLTADSLESADTSPASSEAVPVWQQWKLLTPTEDPTSLGRFGRYEVKEILGYGGMGIVMLGYDPVLNRGSAIKVLAPNLSANAAARRRFFREAKSAAAVVHDHVVPIYAVDEEQGVPYLVMPVVEGGSLEQRVQNEGPLDVAETLRIGMQIASGLAAAHEQGLVHRDVKPANVLLANGVERVMITDFGLARAADDATMTQSGVIAGTPQYMSPEQAKGADIDCRSDLFSLGSVLYFMCTGHSPFRAETTMGVLHRIVGDAPRRLASINSDVPIWLQTIIEKLLNKDAEQRYQSAAEVGQELGRWLAHLQQPQQVPPPEGLHSDLARTKRHHISWRQRWVGISGILLCLLSATVVITLELQKGTLQIESQSDVGISIQRADDKSIVKRLMVYQEGPSRVRIAAGQYIVAIDGEHDGLEVTDGKVTLLRGKTRVVQINARSEELSQTPAMPEGIAPPEQVQLVFKHPSNWQLLRHAGGKRENAPARLSVPAGALTELELTATDETPRDRISMQLEVWRAGPAVDGFLHHNAIPISLTEDDLEGALLGHWITKVIFLPDPEYGRQDATLMAEVLSSSRMDPGMDPLVEADRRGTPLAVLRLGRLLPQRSPKELYGVLPENTQMALSTRNLSELIQGWQRTDLAQITQLPALKPLLSQLGSSLAHRALGGGLPHLYESGLLNDFVGRGVLAWCPDYASRKGKTPYLLVVDASPGEYRQLLANVDDRDELQRTSGRDSVEMVYDTRPPKKVDAAGGDHRVFIAHRSGLLLISNDNDTLQKTLDRTAGSDVSTLADEVAFGNCRRRLQAHSDRTHEYQLEYFARPGWLAERLWGNESWPAELIKAMQRTGFESIQCLCGGVYWEEGYDLRNDTFVLAETPLPKAAGILDFANTLDRELPLFVSETTAAVTIFHWNAQDAFGDFSSLVDELAGTPGVFEEVLKGIQRDPNGPRIDVENELLPLLTGEILLLNECSQVDVDHEIIALRVHDPAAMERLVTRAMNPEPAAKIVEATDYSMWIVEKPDAKPDCQAWQNVNVLSVVDDYLMLAANVKALEATIAKVRLAEQSPLLLTPELEQVVASLEEGSSRSTCCAWRIQTRRAYRTTYEWLRRGEPFSPGSLCGSLWYWLHPDQAAPQSDSWASAWRALPPYSEVSSQFPSSGVVVHATNQGWFVQAMVLPQK